MLEIAVHDDDDLAVTNKLRLNLQHLQAAPFLVTGSHRQWHGATVLKFKFGRWMVGWPPSLREGPTRGWTLPQ